MRNYKQTDVEEAIEERIKKRDIIGVIFAIAGVTILIWGLI
jgi:EamA domain-containing membrane protein RarD